MDNIAENVQENKFRSAFKNLDSNQKGYLTKEDLLAGYKKVYSENYTERVDVIV